MEHYSEISIFILSTHQGWGKSVCSYCWYSDSISSLHTSSDQGCGMCSWRIRERVSARALAPWWAGLSPGEVSEEAMCKKQWRERRENGAVLKPTLQKVKRKKASGKLQLRICMNVYYSLVCVFLVLAEEFILNCVYLLAAYLYSSMLWWQQIQKAHGRGENQTLV